MTNTTNINDQKILELKNNISEKRLQLAKKSNVFKPSTNCILELDNIKYNINVLKREELKLLAIKLNNINKANKTLFFGEELIISGYEIGMWLNDVILKIQVMKYNEDKKQLTELEAKLTEMLSKEKLVELELNNIACLINCIR